MRPLHERAHARLLLGRQAEAVLQLEDVHGPGIAVLIGREGQAEAAAVAHDGVELVEAGLRLEVTLGRRAAGRVLMAGGLGSGGDGDERRDQANLER